MDRIKEMIEEIKKMDDDLDSIYYNDVEDFTSRIEDAKLRKDVEIILNDLCGASSIALKKLRAL